MSNATPKMGRCDIYFHRRDAEHTEELFYFFSAIFVARATCRVVARRAKTEAGGEINKLNKALTRIAKLGPSAWLKVYGINLLQLIRRRFDSLHLDKA